MLGQLLGRGGMAEVYAGFAVGSLGFQKPVAIKRLLPDLAQDREFVGRLVGEAKLLVGLSHTNVISVLDLVRDEGDVFLVMELVDGPSVRQLLAARKQAGLGPLPLGLAAYIVQAACAGLEYAHSRRLGAVIHADVSPSNVLLTTAGEVKVADFGIARPAGATGTVEGKWGYMSPEQARGEALDARSDEFAIGVVLYELLTGVHPFARRVSEHGRDEDALAEVRPLRELRPEIPAALEAACLRAMAPARDARYPRVQELHDALAEIRFASGWREGASELAAAIRAARAAGEASGLFVAPAIPSGPRTLVTSRPVTLMTRSLLVELPVPVDLPDAVGAPAPVDFTDLQATFEFQRLRVDPGGDTPHAWARPPSEAGVRARGARLAMAASATAIVLLAIGLIAGRHEPVERAATAPVAGPFIPSEAPSRSDGPGPGTAPVPAPVQAPAPVAVPAPAAVTVTEEDDLALIELEPHEDDEEIVIEPPAPLPRPVARVRRAPARPVRPTTRAEAPARGERERGTGVVRIHSEPWAYVSVGGKRVETPASLTLPPGDHALTLYSPELRRKQTVWATVRAGKTKTIRVRFDR